MAMTLILAQLSNSIFALIGVGMFLVFLGFAFIIFFSLIKPWLQAFTAGCPIALFQIVGMKMRRINPNQIIPHGIAASQAGHPVSWNELESAFLQGVDIEKAVMTYVSTSKQGKDYTFQDVVDAEQASRLEDLLDQR